MKKQTRLVRIGMILLGLGAINLANAMDVNIPCPQNHTDKMNLQPRLLNNGPSFNIPTAEGITISFTSNGTMYSPVPGVICKASASSTSNDNFPRNLTVFLNDN